MNSPHPPEEPAPSAPEEVGEAAVAASGPFPGANAGTPVPEAPASPARLGFQAKLVMAGIALCALAALFWPRDGGTFKEPGGFLYDGGGLATTLGPHLAPVTLIHFWATWCAPCITEIPALQRLSADLAPERGFTILYVAVADNKERVVPFLGSAAEMAFYDPKWDVAHRYGTRQLPESYIVVDGKVVQKFDGPANWDDPALRDSLRGRIHKQRAALEPSGTRLAALASRR